MNATDEGSQRARGSIAPWLGLIAVAAVVLVYLAWSVRRPTNQGTTSPAIGRTLPYLRLEPLTGDATAVSLADLKGHVTLVNYWGTWCPPCRLEFPHIVELAAKFKSHDDFKLYAVSCGAGGGEDRDALRAETQSFLDAAKTDLPTWWDENAASRRALQSVTDDQGFGYPTTLVLDRQAVIRGMWTGYSRGTEREMEALVSELLR